MVDILEAKDLHFSYPDGKSVLRSINLSVKKGEFLGVLGANGSGKTTLLKILNHLLKTAKGEIYLEGKNIRSINKDMLFRKICTCFQNPDDQLFASTVGEDIAFGPVNMGLTKEEVSKRIEYALGAVSMLEFTDKPIHNLSFGEKKRICLAGVLAMGPEVMLLDEPTSSLDPMGASAIMRLLRKLNKENGITMVMSTHSVDLVPLFIDRVIILNQGRIILDGKPENVFSQAQVIREAKLRLPRIGHLFEILRKKDGFNFNSLPLTIGEAREAIKSLPTVGRAEGDIFRQGYPGTLKRKVSPTTQLTQ
ncbi:MAG: ATP-binding cassette domain-containing protein [Candidatus Omnitrophota bacterium]|nr:ATP-binding cassette domain-containing protein [Candidatus Omnitrophota bacterium]